MEKSDAAIDGTSTHHFHSSNLTAESSVIIVNEN